MSKGFDYSKLTGMKLLFAKLADKDGSGFLEKTESYDEVSVFNKMCESFEKGVKDKFKEASIWANDEVKDYKPKILDLKPEVTDIKLSRDYLKEEKLNLISLKIQQEAKKKNAKLSSDDIKYWADRILSVSEKYKLQPNLLTAVIAKETNGTFKRNINSPTGAGPMQVNKSTIQDFFPNAKGNWKKVKKKMDENLLNDILYKKDENGEFEKDSQGNFILAYSSPDDLRRACTKDDELGIKVGLICLKMKYAKAVAEIKYGKANYKNVPVTIDKLKSGEIKLTDVENQRAIEVALKNYNSVFKSYASEVIDTLRTSGFDFSSMDLIKPKE